MSMPILWVFILTNAILVSGAPKLGHVLFDPLSYEANKYDKLKAFLRDVIAQNETIKPSTKFCGSCVEDNPEKIKPNPTTTEKPQNIARNNEAPVKTTNKVSELLKVFENAMEKVKLKNPLRQGSSDDINNKDKSGEYDFDGAICRIVNNRLLCGYDKNKGELKTDEFVDVGNGCRLFKDRVECGYETPPFTGNVRRPPARDSNNLRSRSDDNLKNIARTVLKAISEQESKMGISTNESKTGSPSITESVSPKFTEDISNSTTATVTDNSTVNAITDSNTTITAITDSNTTITAVINSNSTITAVTDSNSTLTATTESLVTSTTEEATKSSDNFTTETTQNLTSSTSTSPDLVTIPILEYLLKYFLPLRMLAESSSTTTLAPSTLKVTSDLLISETAVESSPSSESEEFLTNDIEVDFAENSSVSTSPISEVTGKSSHQQTNVVNSSRSLKIVRRRSADPESAETTLRSQAARDGNKPARWCVEKGDRIVCYYADNSFVLD